MDLIPFLDRERVARVVAIAGTPVYVYDETTLRRQAAAALSFPSAFGLTARYAMKACPNAALLRLFTDVGMAIDASSGYEVARAIRAGVDPARISLSTQELPEDFAEWVREGITVNACSLGQLERFGRAFPGGRIGLRINPGLGSGGTTKTNTGGPASSFGIWHELLPQADEIIARHGLVVFRIHSHIGSGSDPDVWVRVASMTLSFVEKYASVTHCNLGGGYKVARMPHEKGTDLQVIGTPVKRLFEEFAARTGRRLHLEIEPGTFMVANAGAIVTRIQDIITTGESGYRFLKLDTGMTELARPSLYGAQHPMKVVPANDEGSVRGEAEYIATGHCCESGDMLTPKAGEPETLEPRRLLEARVGDHLVIGGAGAYASAMATINYNSFPQAPEVLLRENGEVVLIRRRQTLDQVLQNEMLPSA
jgi:diaminopimelate decarboxylase